MAHTSRGVSGECQPAARGSRGCRFEGVPKAGAPIGAPGTPVSRATEGVPLTRAPPSGETPPMGRAEALGGGSIVRRVRMKTRCHWPRRRRKIGPVLSNWMAVRVQNNRERFARRKIEDAGGNVFVPWIMDEGALYETPLFPGYIFVEGPEWYYLKTTQGVLHPIMMGDSPAFMPIREIKALMKACGREGIISLKAEKFSPGDTVRVKKGAWQGHWGVYIQASKADRVRVLFQILGGRHEIEFHRTNVTKRKVGVNARDEAMPPNHRARK